MRVKHSAAYVLAGLLAVIPAMIAAQQTPDAKTVVLNALKAMGGESLRTVQFSGMGSIAGIGQNRNPRAPWPVSRLKLYARELDLAAAASHVKLVRVQGRADQTQEQFIGSGSPWSVQFDYWLTPFGFLKGALDSDATVRSQVVDEAEYNVVSYSLQGKYRVVGFINDQNMVERVQTWIDNDVLGDMRAEASYGVYKDFGGVKFPTMIIESQGGFPVLILSVNDVKPNAAVRLQAPQAAANAGAAQGAMVVAEKIADGVYYLKGGTHHSVAVEFSDHVAVIEAAQNESRSLAVIAEANKLFPGKAVRYLVNTHHHFDHSGGLRTYVDAGAIILTHQINKDFYEKAFSTPRSLAPDRLALSAKKALIEAVGDKRVLSDGSRVLELHLIKDNLHSDGILLAFLPKEKILIEVDVYTPAAAIAPTAGSAAAANPNTANLADNVERLRLDFEKILPLHGPGAASRADLYAAIGKPVPDIMSILNPPQEPAAPGAGQRGQTGQPAGAAAVDPTAALLSSACSGCHNLLRVQNKKATEDEWTSTVERMKGKGAELSDEETQTLIDYLARTYK
jgi:glyoxylase-like metal-dependent hydrolase (beta-lactamase superfamily II)